MYVMFFCCERMNDYNKNRITSNLVGMTNNRDNFKIPSYYNKHTMSKDCSANNLIESKERPCRKGTPSTQEFFPLDNLTKAQQKNKYRALNQLPTSNVSELTSWQPELPYINNMKAKNNNTFEN